MQATTLRVVVPLSREYFKYPCGLVVITIKLMQIIIGIKTSCMWLAGRDQKVS